MPRSRLLRRPGSTTPRPRCRPRRRPSAGRNAKLRASPWIASGKPSAGLMMSISQVTIVRMATAGAAARGPTSPPTATPMPASASANSPRTSEPRTGVTTSPPELAVPIPIPIAHRTAMTTMPLPTPSAPEMSQRTRSRGVASRNSSRPDDSSDAHPPTSVAAASPTSTSPNSTNRSCRKPPTVPMSMPGKMLPRSLWKSGADPSCSTNDRPEPAIKRPNRPSPMPHASAVGRFSLAVRPAGPWMPARARGRPGQGIALVAPRSRRTKASMPTAHRTITTIATRISGAQSNWPARGQVVGGPAEPGEVGEWGEARDGALVSIQEEPAEGDRAGDAGRRSTAEDGRQRERHGPRGQRQEAEPDRVAGGGVHAERIARQLREGAAGDHDRNEDHGHRDHDRRHVAEQLLERDPSPGHGIGRDEFEAAAARLGGQRAGQCEDRPEADHEREERPVLVLEVAAQRLDIDRLAGQALQGSAALRPRRHRSRDATRALRTGTRSRRSPR